MTELSKNTNPPLSLGKKAGIFFKSLLKGYVVTLLVVVILLMAAGFVAYFIK